MLRGRPASQPVRPRTGSLRGPERWVFVLQQTFTESLLCARSWAEPQLVTSLSLESEALAVKGGVPWRTGRPAREEAQCKQKCLEKQSPAAEEVMSQCSASRERKWEQRQSSESPSLTFDHDIQILRKHAGVSETLLTAMCHCESSEVSEAAGSGRKRSREKELVWAPAVTSGRKSLLTSLEDQK